MVTAPTDTSEPSSSKTPSASGTPSKAKVQRPVWTPESKWRIVKKTPEFKPDIPDPNFNLKSKHGSRWKARRKNRKRHLIEAKARGEVDIRTMCIMRTKERQNQKLAEKRQKEAE